MGWRKALELIGERIFGPWRAFYFKGRNDIDAQLNITQISSVLA